MKTTKPIAISRVVYEHAVVDVAKIAIQKLAEYLPDYQVIEISLARWDADDSQDS